MRKLVLLFIVLLLVPVASAKYITISVGMMSSNFINGSSGVVNLSVSNLGDEPAHDFFLNPILPEGFTSDTLFVGVFGQNKGIMPAIIVNVSDKVIPGEYHFNLLVQYSDSNGYLFSMVNPVKIVYLKQAPSMITGSIEKMKITGAGKQTLKLRLATSSYTCS